MVWFQGPLASLGAAAVNNLFTARFAKFRRVWHTKDLTNRFTRWPDADVCTPDHGTGSRSALSEPLLASLAHNSSAGSPILGYYAAHEWRGGALAEFAALGPGATRNDNRYSVAGRCCGCDARHYRQRFRSRAAAGFGQTAAKCWRQHERCYFCVNPRALRASGSRPARTRCRARHRTAVNNRVTRAVFRAACGSRRGAMRPRRCAATSVAVRGPCDPVGVGWAAVAGGPLRGSCPL